MAVVIAAAILSGCAKRKHTRVPAPPRVGTVEEGVASWYGHPHHGKRSSNGEIYDMEKLTAAHRTLPFETIVRVQNLTNDRTVDVRITDRGPFVKDRIIDLSRAAARQIRMIGPGTAPVRLYVLSLPDAAPPRTGYFAVQAGAYAERANAERQREEMERRYGTAQLQFYDGDPPVWRVLVGREDTMEGARELAGRVAAETGAAFVVRVQGGSTD